MTEQQKRIIQTILDHYPQTQAIYLYGSYGTADERPSSDVDIALLLPPAEAKQIGSLILSDLHLALQKLLERDVDLINLRRVNTVLQKEIVMSGRQISCADAYAAAEFEMLTLSFYQKLNEERRGILEEFALTGRAYPV